MRQCRMRKSIRGCDSFLISWIPEKFAKVGKFLKLKGEDGWEVVDVFTRKCAKEVNERGQDYKRTRLASDI